MPRYVCDACGEVFKSKEARDEHEHDSDRSRLQGLQFTVPDLTLKQFAVLGGVFLMATLFMGTVFFASSLSPGSPGGSGGASSREPSPPVGYTIQSQGDIPRVSEADLPASAVSDTPLSEDVQLYLLTQQSVLLQYSCSDCPDTVAALSDIASTYNSDRTWVYVAPYPDMDDRVAATGFQRGPLRLETVDRDELGSFICDALQDQPIQCVVG